MGRNGSRRGYGVGEIRSFRGQVAFLVVSVEEAGIGPFGFSPNQLEIVIESRPARG